MTFSHDYSGPSSSTSSSTTQWQATPTSIVQQKALIGALICIGANTLVSLALNVQKKAHQQQEAEDAGDDDEEGDEQENDQRRSSPGEAAQQQQSQGQHTQTTGYGGTTNREGAAARRQQSRSNGNDDGQHRRSDSSQSGSGNNGGSSGGGPNAKFLRSRLWWLGFALMTTGEAGNFISYGFAPASLVAPLGSVALLANVFIAPVMLKERFATSDLLGVLLASLGAAGVVAAAATDGGGGGDLGGTPDALWQAMTQTIFEDYAGIMAVLGGLLAWLSSTSAGDKYILVDVGACAVFGGFTVLATKGVSSLISHAAGGGDFGLVLRSPLSYALVVVLVGTALVQIAMLNRALQRFDARSVIPSQFVFFTISAISGSAVLFRDFERASAGRVLGFVAGCLTTFAGVFVLTRRKDGENGDDDDEGQDGDAQGTSSARGRRSLRRRQKGRSRASSSVVIVDEERQALLPVGPKSPDNAQSPPTGPLATMSTGSKAATNTSQTVALTSSGGSTSAAIPRPVLPNPRSSRTPRLSLVGGSAMGGGGYLLLASPSSSWSSRGVGALSTATGAGAASTSAVAHGPSKTRRASGPSSGGTSGMTKISGSDVERGSKSVDTWRRDRPARRESERSGDGEQDRQAQTTTAEEATDVSTSHDARIAANEERRRQDPRSSDVPAMPLNLPANFGSTGNSATPPAAAGAESSFRSQLSGFRWAQGSNDDSASRAQPASTGGSSLLPSWMSSSTSNTAPAPTPASNGSWLSSYVPLRSSTRPDSEEASLSLSHWDRLLAFLACLAGSFICFLFSFLFLLSPLPKLRKFALSFSLGSMLFMVGFAVLVGPLNHLRHMASKERAPFSIAYVGSLLATLYFALGPRVTLPTLLAGVVQVGALLAYLAAYFPGGTTTLRYAAQWAARGMGGWLPL